MLSLVFVVTSIPLNMLGASTARYGAPASEIQIPNLDIKRSRAIECLKLLAERYKVVIGVTGSWNGLENSPIDISISNGTLRDALDSISQQDKHFSWAQASD